MSAATLPLRRRERVPDYLTAVRQPNVSPVNCHFSYFSLTDSSMTEQGWQGGLKLQSSPARVLKAFLLSSVPFRQGLNCCEIIAVMSKGNLPQTEAGSSVAVAPGEAELLSFLKCQPGTGTGSCAVISSCALSSSKQQRRAGSLQTRLSPAPLPNLNI